LIKVSRKINLLFSVVFLFFMVKLYLVMSQLIPKNVIDNLMELQALTGNADGSQRLAWSETWLTACDWLRQKLANLPVEIEVDQAGNTWATLKGAVPQSLVLGSHIDSVANGGWLDGCLGVLGGLEILRRFSSEGTPPVTIRLVSWADEEGTQFGPSLFGSSAVSGNFDPNYFGQLTDKNGSRLEEVVARYGVDIEHAKDAANQLKNVSAYIELHIEQGPLLESLDKPLAAVTGALGVERHTVRFTGQAAHAGSTPMEMRRDALAAAAKLALEIREIAKRNAGVCTIGSVITRPGIDTAVVGECDCLLDQRNHDAAALARMFQEAQESSQRFAAEERVEVEWKRLYRIEPVAFNPQLIDLCDESIIETCGVGQRMPSGPLHDAVEMARASVPTAMMFVQSLNGLSHTKEEDTRPEHLLLAEQAFDRLAAKTVAWILRNNQADTALQTGHFG
jgi:hydantoinase/carbamoylase family amidase